MSNAIELSRNGSGDVLPPGEDILASAVNFLVAGGERQAANALLTCTLDLAAVRVWESCLGQVEVSVQIVLYALRQTYDLLAPVGNPVRNAAEGAFQAVLPAHCSYDSLVVRGESVAAAPDWRSEFRDSAVHNQAAFGAQPVIWNSLRFRSCSEVRIAVALDRAHALYLPNCLARLDTPAGRQNREADFLVCIDGHWGILEVDGEPFHPQAAVDHERDRLFRTYGIRVVERFSSGLCFNKPDEVVAQFIGLLKRW